MNSPSLFTDPLFCLLSPSSTRDKKIKTAADLLTANTGGNGGERRKQAVGKHLWEQLKLVFTREKQITIG